MNFAKRQYRRHYSRYTYSIYSYANFMPMKAKIFLAWDGTKMALHVFISDVMALDQITK